MAGLTLALTVVSALPSLCLPTKVIRILIATITIVVIITIIVIIDKGDMRG